MAFFAFNKPLERRLMMAIAALLLCLGLAGQAHATELTTQVKAPAGFETLLESQQTVADVFFGGRAIGQARITLTPGKLVLNDVRSIVERLPAVKDAAAVERALQGELDTHGSLVCSPNHGAACGKLSPAIAGIIYDADKFRIDLFIAAELQEVQGPREAEFLKPPTAGLSAASIFDLTLAGAVRQSSAFNLQNRTVLGYKNFRVRSDASFSSAGGPALDTVVGEIDRRSLRYSAGLFWAPSVEFTGDRKLLGVGVSTQFDTRADKELLRSTPLVIFLPQASVVEVLRDGRLLASERRDAGNQALDTSSLPEGSYEIELQIKEAGGATRTERRLFIKNRQMVPEGVPVFFAHAGYLAQGEKGAFPVLASGLFLQAGIAKRILKSTAVDATAVAHAGNVLGQLGVTAFTRSVNARVAGFASSRGDYGGLAQLSSSDSGPIGFNFDLRRIVAGSGRGPTDLRLASLGGTETHGPASGSFIQASGNVSFRLGDADVGIIASYRKDSRGSTYAIGPRVYWNVVQRGASLVSVFGEATRSDRGNAAYLGIRVQSLGGRSAFSASTGAAYFSKGIQGAGGTSFVGQYQGSIQRSVGSMEVAAEAGLERTREASIVRSAVRAAGRLGYGRADVQHSVNAGATQYSMNFRTGLAATAGAAALGGKEPSESAVIVSVQGQAGDSAFEVLVDNISRGQVSAGGRLPIFLTPYREYSIRIRPMDGPQLSFDSSERRVSLYPGNIEALSWDVQPVLTAYGRALRADGSPAANADVSSQRGLGRTDENGFFQLEIGASDSATLKWANGETCSIKMSSSKSKGDLLSLGTVLCN